MNVGRLEIAIAGFCLLRAAGVAAQPALATLPVGATVPVLLEHSLDAGHAQAGETLTAQLSQRVPLGGGRYLRASAEVLGSVVSSTATTLSIAFTQVRLHHATEPVQVQLLAAADRFDVQGTRNPLGGASSRSTSDWTTEQIGGDEIYGVNIATKVYDRYSQPVGRADGTGVYAPPLKPGLPERAMGPFSTTAAGLYDLPGFAIGSSGGPGGPIVFRLMDPKWKLRAGSALLLKVLGP